MISANVPCGHVHRCSSASAHLCAAASVPVVYVLGFPALVYRWRARGGEGGPAGPAAARPATVRADAAQPERLHGAQDEPQAVLPLQAARGGSLSHSPSRAATAASRRVLAWPDAPMVAAWPPRGAAAHAERPTHLCTSGSRRGRGCAAIGGAPRVVACRQPSWLRSGQSGWKLSARSEVALD